MALLALVAAVTAACGPARYVSAPPRQPSELMLPEVSVTRHVVLISVDGLRPDAIGLFATPTLERLMREGRYTLAATTIVPSKTLPSHTSMLSGELPERHGVLWNDLRGARGTTIETPTMFSIARAVGYTTAAFFSKSKFQHLQRPGTLDYSQAPGGWWGRWSNERTARDVETHLRTARPNLLFVHLSDPDRTGHRSGWMGEAYGRAVSAADAAVARVLTAAERAYGAGNYSVIVTADHGGHDRDHGSDDPRDVTIPWMAWGRGVPPGPRLGSPVRTIDTAATVLWLLGLPGPAAWAGTPILEVFEPADLPVTADRR